MIVNKTIITSSFFLFIVTTIVAYGILRLSMFVNIKDSIIVWKTILYAMIFSIIFTIFITFISIKIDKPI